MVYFVILRYHHHVSLCMSHMYGMITQNCTMYLKRCVKKSFKYENEKSTSANMLQYHLYYHRIKSSG